jgi:hypothetical protein
VPTRVVREDPDRAGLLYAGTEFGMYLSFDDGAHWRAFQLNLPTTPVTDIQLRRQDMVLSTQGRAFWILDDLTPLHQASDAIAAERAHLFAPRTAIRYRYRAGFGGIEGDRGAGEDTPQYPPAGAMIDYSLGAAPSGPVTLEILDRSGAVVRSFSSDSGAGGPRLPARVGLNRFIWDMTYPGPWSVSTSQRGSAGPMAAPGRYTVRLTANGVTSTQPLVLKADPRALRDGITQQILEQQLAFNLRARDLVSDANRAAEQVRSLRARADGNTAAVAALEQELLTPPVRYSRPALQEHIGYLYRMSLGGDQQISQDARERYAELKAQLDAVKRRLAQSK